jgi:transcriptional regulator GlxA family with amidase domain
MPAAPEESSMHRSTEVSMALAALLVGATAAQADSQATQKYTRNVAIAIWNGAEILDWAGPSEVFAAASHVAQHGSENAFNVYTVSKTKDPIVSQGFIDVIADYTIADAPKPDIVVFPGGGGRSVLEDPEFFAWASRAAKEAEVAVSVCTGAFVLAKAGLLDDKPATTWYGQLDRFEAEYPKTRVQRGCRFVDNGQVVTTAGVSAGIDGSLHLVARLLGRHVADQTAQYMEYRWTPEPYLSKDYSVLNPSLDERGRRLQQAGIFTEEKNYESAIQVGQALTKEDPNDAAAWMQLRQSYHASKRYDDAMPAFAKAARSKDLAAGAWYNAACSAGLDQDKAHALEYLGKAFDAGFKYPDYARNDSDLAILRGDPKFDALLAKASAANARTANR